MSKKIELKGDTVHISAELWNGLAEDIIKALDLIGNVGSQIYNWQELRQITAEELIEKIHDDVHDAWELLAAWQLPT